MPSEKYRLTFTEASKEDQLSFKRYILQKFRYREYGKKFDEKMKSAYRVIKNVNNSIDPLKILYRGYNIYMLPHQSYLFFYVVNEVDRTIILLRVLQNGMDWMPEIIRWISQNK